MQKATTATDTANPSARIGFVIHYPFQFFVYKNVYKHLKAESEFIIDLGVLRPVRQPEGLLREIVELLDAYGASYRILHYDDYAYETYLRRFFDKYKMLVSLWERGCVMLTCNGGRKIISFTYGAGKDLNIVRPARGVSDLVLAYGKRDQELSSLLTNAIIVGNPKFDDWFDGTVDMESIRAVAARLDPKKNTILYLPTHSDLSSIDQLADELMKLSDSYNVIVKFHYYTPREEPDRVKKLTHPGIIQVKDDADLLPLLKAADVVVSDNSSVIFDAILAEKSLVVADFWDQVFLDAEHREMRQYRRGKQGALTYSGSIEQVVKREGIVPTITRAAELGARIEEVLRDAPLYRQKQSALRDELFSFNDGKCGERAAQAIRDAISSDLSARPIMHHAFEAFKRRLGALSYGRERMLNQKIASYEAALKANALSKSTRFGIVLLRDEVTDTTTETESLRALFEQDFPREKFEVHIVNPVNSQQIRRDDAARLGSVSIIEHSLPERVPLGSAVAQIVETSNAGIICFTTSSHVVPSDWLLSLYAAYERHPGVGGVGGYVRADTERYTIFDEILYYELGRLFGVEREREFLSKLYEVQNQLMYQNPAGDLASMSYRKELMPFDLAGFRTTHALAQHLKISVMGQRPLCFIPRSVTRLTRMTIGAFMRMHYEQGFLNRMSKTAIVTLGAYRRQTLIAAIGDSVHAALRYKDVRHGALIFLAGTACWVGNISAAGMFFRERAELAFRDVLRSHTDNGG